MTTSQRTVYHNLLTDHWLVLSSLSADSSLAFPSIWPCDVMPLPPRDEESSPTAVGVSSSASSTGGEGVGGSVEGRACCEFPLLWGCRQLGDSWSEDIQYHPAAAAPVRGCGITHIRRLYRVPLLWGCRQLGGQLIRGYTTLLQLHQLEGVALHIYAGSTALDTKPTALQALMMKVVHL